MPRRITQADIKSVLNEYPGLRKNGFADNRRQPYGPDDCPEERQEILQEHDRIDQVAKWLGGIDKIKSTNPRYNSYELKDFIEPECGFLSHGAMIVAAKLAGFRLSRIANSGKVRLNISEKSLKSKLSGTARFPS